MALRTKKLRWVFILFLIMLGQRLYADNGTTKILYDEKMYFSSQYHVPVSNATIRGIKTKVVMDTAGSGAPILTEKFAKRAKIIGQAEDITSPIFLDKRIKIDLGSLKINFNTLGVSKTQDKWFEKQNVAGLFNPLTVGPAVDTKDQVNNVVLDFLTKRFYGVQAPTQQMINEYLDKKYTKQTKIVAPIRANKYYRLIVQGSIEGREEVPLLIDTGANSSFFDKPYLADIPVVKQHHIGNFTGQAFISHEIAARPVLLNAQVIGKTALGIYEASTEVAGPFSFDESIIYRGIIGMDLLKNCAIVISLPQTATFYCNPQ